LLARRAETVSLGIATKRMAVMTGAFLGFQDVGLKRLQRRFTNDPFLAVEFAL
jgi:hypothetical protein